MVDQIIFAHRGASGLAPENTMSSFRAAHGAGATWIETDVDILGDGTAICIHDTTLDRTTNRDGGFYDLTIDDLETIDAGSWYSDEYVGEKIPTLRELVAWMNDTGMNANIEIKSNEAGAKMCYLLIDSVLAELENLDGPEVIISSFNHLLLRLIKDRAPHMPLGCLFTPDNLWPDWISILELVGADYIHPGIVGLTRDKVQTFRAAGYGVNVYTVDNPALADQLFDWGATGIFTNVPHLMLPQARG